MHIPFGKFRETYWNDFILKDEEWVDNFKNEKFLKIKNYLEKNYIVEVKNIYYIFHY